MTAAAGQAEQTAGQARAAASAYQVAFTTMVPPPVIAANRTQLASLTATNILGQNTPAIAANEAQYGEMWAQDATAMYGYAGVSATASTSLTKFTAAPQTTSWPGRPRRGLRSPRPPARRLARVCSQRCRELSLLDYHVAQSLASPSPSTSSTSGLSGLLSSLLGGSSSGTSTTTTGILGGLTSSSSGLSLSSLLPGCLPNTRYSPRVFRHVYGHERA